MSGRLHQLLRATARAAQYATTTGDRYSVFSDPATMVVLPASCEDGERLRVVTVDGSGAVELHDGATRGRLYT